MIHMTIDMPEEALAALRTDPENFTRELRLAAAVKWYEIRPSFSGQSCQNRRPLSYGVSYSTMQFGVSPFQHTAEEALEEAGRE